MLIEWIERTRKKPKAVRNRYAFIGATVFTTIVTMLWIVSLPTRLNSLTGTGTETAQTAGAFSQFFSTAKDNLATAISSVKNQTDTATSGPNAVDNQSSYLNSSTTDTQSISVPKLNADTIKAVQSRVEEQNKPQPRTVMIATTSTRSTQPLTEE